MDIGIDLGTTFSVIAVNGEIELAPGYTGADYLSEIDVTILPSATGNLTIPSVMWWHPDEPDRYVFGDEATQIGSVTSAAVSHRDDLPVALAYLRAGFVDPGTEVRVEVEGVAVPATVFWHRPID